MKKRKVAPSDIGPLKKLIKKGLKVIELELPDLESEDESGEVFSLTAEEFSRAVKWFLKQVDE